MNAPSELELKFDFLWELLYPDIDLETEQQILPDRKYRFDYLHPEAKVAIEVNGGVWKKGNSGHSSGTGIIRDYTKNNLAIAQGYVVFWLSAEMITEDWLGTIARTILKRTGE